MAHFIETSSEYSPFKNSMIEQAAKVSDIINDINLFRSQSDELFNNIIVSMNTEISDYEDISKRAILNDIYEQTIALIDWDSYKKRLINDVDAKKPIKVQPWVKLDIDKLDDYTLDTFDDDYIMTLITEVEDNPKQFNKDRYSANVALKTLIDGITEFETTLCEFRSDRVKRLARGLETLYAVHVSYVRQIKKGKSDVRDTISIDGTQVKLMKSQSQFIKSAIKSLLVP